MTAVRDGRRVRYELADPRIGHHFIYPGCGYGGSCFPKDVKALIHIGSDNGVPLQVLNAVEAANERQKHVLVERVVARFGEDLSGRTLAVWGLMAVAVVLPLTLLNMRSICQPVDDARRLVGDIRSGLEYSTPDSLEENLPVYLHQVQQTCARASEAITRKYFSRGQELSWVGEVS